MDALAAQSLLLPNSRAVFVQNRLVIVQPAGQDSWIRALEDLGQPRLRRLALGNPETVPAGRYARAALESAGLYQPLAQAQKLVFAENVRQALTYVEQGNFSKAFEGGSQNLPLGVEPVLLTSAKGRPGARGAQVLSLYPPKGKGIDIALNAKLLHMLSKLLRDAVSRSDWDFRISLLPGGAGLSPVPSRTLN